MNQMISLLGSTGSIGTQVLDVVRLMPERFTVSSLAAGKNLARLAEQVREFRPRQIAIQSESDIPALRALLLDFEGDILAGPQGLVALAEDIQTDTVIVGLVGLAGLEPSLAAVKAGKRLLTANKETFVTGGHLMQSYLAQIVPIDSEHVAIHQCLYPGGQPVPLQAIRRLYLTASGGPFRLYSVDEMKRATLDDALRHPNWVMGSKITIDSATMMNKGLEVIEAHWLFGVPYDQIDVVVHPESIIHGGVEFVDGSILVQMGAPDMHGPIQYAMTYPERLPNLEPGVRLDLLSLSRLHLEPPDLDRFPCVRLAYEAGRMGSSATAVLNGADEMAVQLFLQGEIDYVHIYKLLSDVIAAHEKEGLIANPTLEEIGQLDAWARAFILRATKAMLV